MRNLQQAYYSNNASVNTNTNTNTENKEVQNMNEITNNMEIIKAELIVNITLGANNVLTEGTIAKAQSKKGVIMNTRSVGKIRYNSNDDSVYADFIPLPNKSTDKYGAYNCAIWRLTFANGTTKVLNHSESVIYWNHILQCEGGLTAEELDFYVKVNFDSVEYNRSIVSELIRTTAVRSYSITFTDLDNMFYYCEDSYRNNLRLMPNGAVEFNSAIVETEKPSLSGKATSGLFRVPSAPAKINFSNFKKDNTKSRRTEAKVEAQSEELTISFDPTPAPKATVAAAKASVEEPKVEEVKVEAPIVDAEKEELRRENAELKAEVAGLKTELANTNAKLDQILAMMSAQATPAPAPVVEEVEEVEEPVEESVEEESVEEEVEEPKPSNSRAAHIARMRANRAKTQKQAEMSVEDLVDDEDLDNLMG